MKKLLLPLFALVLVGAGCSLGSETKTETEMPPVPVVKTETKTETKTEVKTETSPSSGETQTLTPATTDDTWKTYTNAALGFSFMWPTKGRYAPEWEVKVYDLKNPNIPECFLTAQYETEPIVSLGGDLAFTRSHFKAASVDHTSLYHCYSLALPNENSRIVIGFSKQYYPADEACLKGTNASGTSVKGVCSPFVEADYQSALDGIVGTFKKTE